MERYTVLDANLGAKEVKKNEYFDKAAKVSDKIIETGNKNGSTIAITVAKIKLRPNYREIQCFFSQLREIFVKRMCLAN